MNQVAREVRKQLSEIMSKELDISFDDASTLLFANLGSIRLSSTGNAEMKKVFQHYTFQPETEIKDLQSFHFVSMDKLFTYPYYIGKKNIVLYSSEDAVAVNLYGGMDEFLISLSNSCKFDKERK